MMKIISMLTIWLSALCIPATEFNTTGTEKEFKSIGKIQVALLLDTSGSMDGLLEQAKSQLWKMVNELASSKKYGVAPSIELALYEYGRASSSTPGFLEQLVPLSSDLDLVSEKLFALKTTGSQEYCGWVIQDATQKLNWSTNNGDLKIIIIAGNEVFTQGAIDYKISCKEAVEKDIIVNTIYCGDCNEGIRYLWKDAAIRGEGQYMCINQNNKVAHVETPYDAEIGQLNDKLNKTYIAIGKEGIKNKERQLTQDNNAKSYGGSNTAERAISKSKKSTYDNSSWDAVDKIAKNDRFLEEVEESELPEEMKGMSIKERKLYVEGKGKERAEIQVEIQKYADKRAKFIADKRKEDIGKEDNTLDAVMLKTIREQAEKKAFVFENLAEKEKKEDLTTSSNHRDSVVVHPKIQFADKIHKIKTDPVSIREAVINEGKLLLTVQYACGCQMHEFGIIASNIVSSTPQKRAIKVYHNKNKELCEALCRRAIEFDLKELQFKDNEKIILILDGWDTELEVHYR